MVDGLCRKEKEETPWALPKTATSPNRRRRRAFISHQSTPTKHSLHVSNVPESVDFISDVYNNLEKIVKYESIYKNQIQRSSTFMHVDPYINLFFTLQKMKDKSIPVHISVLVRVDVKWVLLGTTEDINISLDSVIHFMNPVRAEFRFERCTRIMLVVLHAEERTIIGHSDFLLGEAVSSKYFQKDLLKLRQKVGEVSVTISNNNPNKDDLLRVLRESRLSLNPVQSFTTVVDLRIKVCDLSKKHDNVQVVVYQKIPGNKMKKADREDKTLQNDLCAAHSLHPVSHLKVPLGDMCELDEFSDEMSPEYTRVFSYLPLYVTETSSSRTFSPFTIIPLVESNTFRFEVYYLEEDKKVLIGEYVTDQLLSFYQPRIVEVSSDDLVTCQLEIKSEYRSISTTTKINEKSFTDYIKSGLLFNCSFAVDLTNYNNEKFNKTCLHQIIPNTNNLYEQIMSIVSDRIDQYNSQRTEFQLIGYGNDVQEPSSTLSKQSVSRSNILSAYRDAIKDVDFSENNMTKVKKSSKYTSAESLRGERTSTLLDERIDDSKPHIPIPFAPNDFYHIISDHIESNYTARRKLSADNTNNRLTITHYQVLIIITPNDHINIRETIFKFVEASHKSPMSIIIFGIGNFSPFRTLSSINMNTNVTEIGGVMEIGVPMRDFESKKKTIPYKLGPIATTCDLIFRGLRANRDVVTFVRLNDYTDVESCVEDALRSVPKQLCKFLKM
ncbi:Cpne8 [Acrasis kona]|uniref:Cpne8 n=1 Tax=Acrasis kona TaxID=1008807 RepID=A0AAW2YJ20_9EUKA